MEQLAASGQADNAVVDVLMSDGQTEVQITVEQETE